MFIFCRHQNRLSAPSINRAHIISTFPRSKHIENQTLRSQSHHNNTPSSHLEVAQGADRWLIERFCPRRSSFDMDIIMKSVLNVCSQIAKHIATVRGLGRSIGALHQNKNNTRSMVSKNVCAKRLYLICWR